MVIRRCIHRAPLRMKGVSMLESSAHLSRLVAGAELEHVHLLKCVRWIIRESYSCGCEGVGAPEQVARTFSGFSGTTPARPRRGFSAS